jgi:hypothetical protein
MNFVNPGLVGQVNLSPALLEPQFPDPFAKRNTNISCHFAILRLVFTLNLAYALFSGERPFERMASSFEHEADVRDLNRER